VALDLHDVLVGIAGLIEQNIARSGPDSDVVTIALLVPRKLRNTGLGDSGPLILSDCFLAVEPALVLQTQFEYLDCCIREERHSRPPTAK